MHSPHACTRPRALAHACTRDGLPQCRRAGRASLRDTAAGGARTRKGTRAQGHPRKAASPFAAWCRGRRPGHRGLRAHITEGTRCTAGRVHQLSGRWRGPAGRHHPRRPFRGESMTHAKEGREGGVCDPHVFYASKLPNFLARWRVRERPAVRGPAGTGSVGDGVGEGAHHTKATRTTPSRGAGSARHTLYTSQEK